MQVIEATVKYPPGKVFPSQHSETGRVNAVFETTAFGDVKVWGDETDPELQALKRKQKRLIGQDQRGNWKLLNITPESDEPAPEPAALPPNNEALWTPDQKRALANYVDDSADLLAHCLKVTQAKLMEPGLISSEDSLRAMATTLFIQAMRTGI